MALSGGVAGGSRLRVLYLSLHDPRSPLTGSAVRAAGFLRRFVRRFDVDLVHFEGSGQPPLPGRPEPPPVAGLCSSAAIPFRRSGYFLFSRAFLGAAERAADSSRPDLAVCDYGTSAVYGLILLRRRVLPFLYSSHNLGYRGSPDRARRDPKRLALAPCGRPVSPTITRRCRAGRTWTSRR